MNNFEPEDSMSDAEIEITDLDLHDESGETPKRYLLHRASSSFRMYTWRTLGVIIGIALLVVFVLVSIPRPLEKKGRVSQTALPPSAYSTVVLSVSGENAYVTSKDGTVTDVRINSGSLVWRQKLKEAGDESAVMNGVMYIASVTTVNNALSLSLNALHTSNGVLLWSQIFPVEAPTLFRLTVSGQEIFVSTEIESFAFHARDGSLLWHKIIYPGLVEAPFVLNGVVYVCTQDGMVHALRANNGSTLWQYKAKLTFGSSLPVMVNGILYLLLEDGSLDTVRTSNGSLLWHNPAQFLFAGATMLGTDGVIYVSTLDGSMYALQANNGFTLWHISSHIPSVAPSMAVMSGVVYVGNQTGSVYALSASNGAKLWQHTEQKVTFVTTTVTSSMVYLVTLIGNTDNIIALGTSNGATRWHYTASYNSTPTLNWVPIAVDNLFLLALQDGSINALHTRNGSLLWHYVTA